MMAPPKLALRVGVVVVAASVAVVAGVHAVWGRYEGFLPWTTLLVSGAAFAAYTWTALRLARVAEPGELGALVVGSLLFPVWAVPLGALTCVVGMLGVPQAIVTGCYLWKRTESAVVGVSSVLGLVVGGGVAWVAGLASPWGARGDAEWVGWIAVGWHLTVGAALVWWCWRTVSREAWVRSWRTHCHACGYPRQGLNGGVCPECGVVLTGVPAVEVEA
jgi:hypothetical protein